MHNTYAEIAPGDKDFCRVVTWGTGSRLVFPVDEARSAEKNLKTAKELLMFPAELKVALKNAENLFKIEVKFQEVEKTPAKMKMAREVRK